MSAGRIAFTVAETTAGPMAFFDREELERVKEERKRGIVRPQIISEPAPPDTLGTSEVSPRVRATLARIEPEWIMQRLVEVLEERKSAAAAPARAPVSAPLSEKIWLTRREAVALSGLPARVIGDALRKHKLGTKSGGRWLVRRSDLERYAEKWKP